MTDAQRIQDAWTDPKLANIVYHDWEASTYDAKWSISYDERCIDYARDRFVHVAGAEGWPYGRALEIGSGTGFFLLNLMQAGVATTGCLTDISPGMVEVAVRNGRGLGLEVSGAPADAEALPYGDEEFDLVVGHAVLHHIPDVELALREVLRVLKPGGRFVFCGEPTARGDFVARRLSRATWWAATRVTQLRPLRTKWAKSPAELAKSSEEERLEAIVDLHTFDPDRLAALAMRAYIEQRNARASRQWVCRIGVHSGAVTAGVVGRLKYIYDIFGDGVNTASRMENHADPMHINVSMSTRSLLDASFVVRDRGFVDVKGKGPMEMFYVDDAPREMPDGVGEPPASHVGIHALFREPSDDR